MQICLLSLAICSRRHAFKDMHLAFHRNNEAFPNPHVIGMKTSLPPLLDRNPEVKQSIMEYAKQNLNGLSAELIYSYLHEVALPALLNDRRAELVNPTLTMEQLLEENQLTKLSLLLYSGGWATFLDSSMRHAERHTMLMDMKNPKPRNMEKQW
jgi:hypothetical protein